MPAPNVAPTKSNLLREKERLALAEEGYELLERKREILMLELMKRIDEVKVLEREMRRRAGTAYPVLRRMLLAAGRDNARELASGVQGRLRARRRGGCRSRAYPCRPSRPWRRSGGSSPRS